MRTNGGWKFLCKDCWGIHLIPYSLLSEDENENVEVLIHCPEINEQEEPWMSFHQTCYPRKEFSRWVGDAFTYDLNVIEEKNIHVRKK